MKQLFFFLISGVRQGFQSIGVALGQIWANKVRSVLTTLGIIIGIASVTGVIGLLSREFLILVLAASAIACPLAWYMLDQWLESFAFRMTMGPWMFVSAVVIACLIALATVTGQAYRAAIRNPAEILGQE